MSDWGDVGYLLASQLRVQILRALEERVITPSQLAQVLARSRSTTSTLLKGLRERGLVECLNPNQRKGRLYSITDKGREALRKAEGVVSQGD
jgi:DNA-binding MarR family transcriptional regulator